MRRSAAVATYVVVLVLLSAQPAFACHRGVPHGNQLCTPEAPGGGVLFIVSGVVAAVAFALIQVLRARRRRPRPQAE